MSKMIIEAYSCLKKFQKILDTWKGLCQSMTYFQQHLDAFSIFIMILKTSAKFRKIAESLRHLEMTLAVFGWISVVFRSFSSISKMIVEASDKIKKFAGLGNLEWTF